MHRFVAHAVKPQLCGNPLAFDVGRVALRHHHVEADHRRVVVNQGLLEARLDVAAPRPAAQLRDALVVDAGNRDHPRRMPKPAAAINQVVGGAQLKHFQTAAEIEPGDCGDHRQADRDRNQVALVEKLADR